MLLHKSACIKPFTSRRVNKVCRSYDMIHEPFPVHSYPSTEQVHFLKATRNVVFSENYIRWASKQNDTISVCIKFDGCSQNQMFDISKDRNPEDYAYLMKLLGFHDTTDKETQE